MKLESTPLCHYFSDEEEYWGYGTYGLPYATEEEQSRFYQLMLEDKLECIQQNMFVQTYRTLKEES